MADELVNRELIDFQTLSGLEDTDYIIVVQSSAEGGKLAKNVFVKMITSGVTPSIQDGYWWVGETNTEIEAAGKTPEFRKGSLGIEWKYTTDSSWSLLVPFSDIKLKFSDLTDSEKASLKLTFADLTEDDIATLQQPAKDMIAQLQATDTNMKKAEAERNATLEAYAKEVDEALQKPTDYLITECEEARDAANNAASTATQQATRAKQLADHPAYIADDNCWWTWDDDKQSYVNTGVLAKGGFLYPYFEIKDDMCLYVNDDSDITSDLLSIDDNGNLIINR